MDSSTEYVYNTTGNPFSGPVKNSRCMACRYCLTRDRDTVYCSMDVYNDGKPFPRGRVFEGDGVLVPRCALYEVLEYLDRRQREKMREGELAHRGGHKKEHHPLEKRRPQLILARLRGIQSGYYGRSGSESSENAPLGGSVRFLPGGLQAAGRGRCATVPLLHPEAG